MRRSAASAPAAFPRCSPSVWRSASSAVLALALAACGSPASTSARDVPFADVARHQLTTYDGPPRVLLGAAVTAVVPDAVAGPGRTLVAAFQGAQRTGGYAITIDRIQRDGERLVVRATFVLPPRGAVVTQVLTSPVHVVSVASSDAAGARTVVLLDGTGAERARAAVD